MREPGTTFGLRGSGLPTLSRGRSGPDRLREPAHQRIAFEIEQSILEAVYRMEFAMGPSVLPKSWGWTCPSAYAAMKKFADGYRDPKTGQCTALSTAYRIEAVPAFVIHPADTAQTAEAAR